VEKQEKDEEGIFRKVAKGETKVANGIF